MYPPADGTHSSPPISQTMLFFMACCRTSIRCVWWMLFCNVFLTRRCHSSRRSNWLCSVAIVVSLWIPFTASTPMATNIRCVDRWSFNSSVNHVLITSSSSASSGRMKRFVLPSMLRYNFLQPPCLLSKWTQIPHWLWLHVGACFLAIRIALCWSVSY